MPDKLLVKKKYSMCWLDPIGGRLLAKQCDARLTAAMTAAEEKGERVYWGTLTYNREPYIEKYGEDAAEALWDTANRERHFRRFIDRLSKVWGVSFTGRWWAKREFQEGGFLHYHFVFIGEYGSSTDPRKPFTRRELQQFKEAWGHGDLVRIAPAWPRNISYCAKYIAKQEDDSFPWFLYHRQRRTLRITSCSPGFFDDADALLSNASELRTEQPTEPPESTRGGGCRGVEGAGEGPLGSRSDVPWDHRQTVGDSIAKAHRRVEVVTSLGRELHEVDHATFVEALETLTGGSIGKQWGYRVFRGTRGWVEQALHYCRVVAKGWREQVVEAVQRATWPTSAEVEAHDAAVGSPLYSCTQHQIPPTRSLCQDVIDWFARRSVDQYPLNWGHVSQCSPEPPAQQLGGKHVCIG